MQTREIPDKLFFKISEVCDIVGVEPYVLRFWKTEFPGLAPEKSKAGHRVYKRKDVENILRVKELLYDRGYTIAGARRHLSKTRLSKQDQEMLLTRVQNELRAI